MQKDEWFAFQDISTPVVITGCAALPSVIREVLGTWSFAPLSGAQTRVAGASSLAPIAIAKQGGGYRMTSRWLKAPVERSDPTDLVCALVIELVWAYLEDHPESLCLHGAAAEFAGRLVVFPNRYRAGKSLLTGCLAAAGHRVFTDDILPVLASGDDAVISGVATGIAPRLRLPLPAGLPADIAGFLDRHAGAQSARYRYLRLPGDLQAQRGEIRPIGALVILDRQTGAAPRLEPVGQAEMLRDVVWQNFARAMPSGDILSTLHGLVASSGRYRLIYDRPQPAIALLKRQFAAWAGPVARVPRGRPAMTVRDAAPLACGTADGAVLYRQRPGVSAHEADGQSFLADADGIAIHHLNQTAATIWKVMASPMSVAEVVALFRSAYPDQPADRLAADITELVDGLKQKQLLQRVDSGRRQAVAR